MRRGMQGKIAAVLLVPVLWPAAVLAQQAPSPAGVVAALVGEATVARAPLPAPQSLKFRDDVFVRDRITTREQSLVRLLLGGKAVVTIRELSNLTITEEPGRPSIVDLLVGKIALVVSRLRMAPGDAIEIRTPNAVAAVRGSFLTTACGLVAAALQCTFSAVEATFPITMSLPTVPPTTFTLGSDQIVNVSGEGAAARATQVRTMTPQERADAAASREGPKQPEHTQSPPRELLQGTGSFGVTEATQLATFLAEANGPIGPAGGPAPPPGTPTPPSTSGVGVNESSVGQAAQNLAASQPGPLGPLSKTLEENFGSVVSALRCDDCSTIIQFGFSFPFFGNSFTTAEVSSNGFLIPGNTSISNTCCDFSPTVSEFLSGPGRIALAWYDLDPHARGAIRFNAFPGRVVVTWDQVPQFFDRAPFNTFQVQLLSDGRIIFAYHPAFEPQTASTSRITLVGITPGGGVEDPGPTNFSSLTTTFDSLTQRTVYEEFLRDSEVEVFDLAGNFIVFAPNGQGGWFVLDPPMAGFSLFSVAEGDRVRLNAPLLNNPSTPQTILGPVAQIDRGELIVPGSTGPLVSLTGGPHSLAILPGTSMFDLTGSATAPEVVEGNTLTLGTDRPIQGESDGSPAPLSVPLLQTSGASLGTEQAMRLDTALLEATAPLMSLRAGSTMTSASDLMSLTKQAKLQASLLPSDALVKLDASTLTVNSGALFNVAGGSALKVTGDLLALNNGSILNIANGALLNVSGGSIASISGALVRFGGTGGNALNIHNTLAPTGYLTGIPVFSSLGGTNGFTITNPEPLVGLNSLGTIQINGTALPAGATGGITGSLIAITGSGGSVRIE